MVVMAHNTDIPDTWEREGESQQYFDRFSPNGYAVGVNIVLYAYDPLRLTRHNALTQECTNAAVRTLTIRILRSCIALCISARRNVTSEVVEAEGHLIDSQLMNAMFDTVVRHDAAFEVLEFRIGRTNDEPSFVSMRVTSPRRRRR